MRPFLGTAVAVAGGLQIWLAPQLLFPRGFFDEGMYRNFTLYGMLVVIPALVAWVVPATARLMGLVVVAASIVGNFAALGGLNVGSILGIVGGCLLIAWEPAGRPASSGTQDGAVAGGAGGASVAGVATVRWDPQQGTQPAGAGGGGVPDAPPAGSVRWYPSRGVVEVPAGGGAPAPGVRTVRWDPGSGTAR